MQICSLHGKSLAVSLTSCSVVEEDGEVAGRGEEADLGTRGVDVIAETVTEGA